MEMDWYTLDGTDTIEDQKKIRAKHEETNTIAIYFNTRN